MCKSQEDRGDYFGLNSESLFVCILYAYRVHIVFTGTHFMHLQTSVFVDKSFKLQECEGFESPLLVPGHKTAAAGVLLRLSFIGEG